jgi:site-specific DNA recombinase
MTRNGTRKTTRVLRCAIYTRKSTEEGLDQDFNSLDAQRESGEAFIKSQVDEGWECLPTCYDDGGFTGGNMDRPALKRLLADIESKLVDVVVVYKVDRLSRSLLDFTRIMETFDRHGVSFVSVTQQFNTTTSMGRLMLNVLLSFAQFEREIISERTRDKMAAARRKGKYVGGAPVLGYDLDRTASRLVVNEREAIRVRRIFEMYLQQQALLPTVAELERLGWVTKQWTTRKGTQRGGRPFDKNTLYNLLTNVVYLGKVCYREEIYEGEHPGIVDAELFEKVQSLLRLNHRNGGAGVRNRFGALLKGLLRCKSCGCGMVHSHSTKAGKRYRYYVCVQAQKRGWHTCQSKSVPADQMEQFVVSQVRDLGRDPTLLADTVAAIRCQTESRLAMLEEEWRAVQKDLAAKNALLQRAALGADVETGTLAELHEQIRHGERRVTTIRGEEARLKANLFSEGDVAEALRDFDSVWESLNTREKVRILQLLIEHVAYDGAEGTITVRFRENGINALQNGMLNEDRPS